MNIKINDLNINYDVKGNGNEKILLLHGWGANIKLFNNIMNFLSKSKKLYALDMPGFGESDEPKNSWNVDTYVEFIIEFIKMMNIKELDILGHSFGGRVIIKLVNKGNLPFKINKIVLVDSAGIIPKKKKTLKSITRSYLYKTLKFFATRKLVKKAFPEALENLKSKFGSQDYRNATPIMRETLVKVVNEDLEYLLSNIKQPTLLIWGENDTATPISDAKIMENKIPDAGLVTVKNAGHYSFLDNPNLVNKVLESFLRSSE